MTDSFVDPHRIRRRIETRHLDKATDSLNEAIFLAKIGGEGVIAKRLSSRYEPGKRSGAWRKKRIAMCQEFVIGGFTLGAHGMDALAVGCYEKGSLSNMSRAYVPA